MLQLRSAAWAWRGLCLRGRRPRNDESGKVSHPSAGVRAALDAGPSAGAEWPRPPGSPARSVLEMALRPILCADAEPARCGLRQTFSLASDGRELLTALGRTLRAGQYRRSCDPGLARMGLSAEAVVLALAWVGAVAGGGAVTTVLGPWYRRLAKPAWQLPEWAVRSRPRRARQRPWSSRTSNRTAPGARVVCLHRLDRARSASARGPLIGPKAGKLRHLSE